MTTVQNCTFERRRNGWKTEGDFDNGAYDKHWLFVLKGPEGCTVFDVTRTAPGSKLHAIYEQYPQFHPADEAGGRWMGWDIGVHSVTEDEYSSHQETCPFTESHCWYDGSSVQAEELLEKWMAAGMDDEIIRAELWEWYRIRLLGEED